MDALDIIQPHDNMDELVADYTNWCLLPHDRRKRSNGECYAKYGCYMPELYQRYKNAIKSEEDLKNMEPDNLVREDASIASEYNNYQELLQISKNLCQSPYIVIIDPSIQDMTELNDKYESYCLLNAKNRRLSNDFSWQIWGYNVLNMYRRMMTKLDPELLDMKIDFYANDNLKKLSESAKALFFNIPEISLSTVNPTLDLYEHMIGKYDINICKIESRVEDITTISPNIFIEHKKKIGFGFDPTILSETPWLSTDEYKQYNKFDYNLNLEDGSYYKTVKEAVDKLRNTDTEDLAGSSTLTERILQLGWNPNIKVNESTIKVAKNRQARALNEELVNIFNVENMPVNSVEGKADLEPMFIILEHEKPELENINPTEITKIGVSFTSNLRRIITFGKDTGTYIGMKVERLNDYKYGTILVSFISQHDISVISNLMDKIVDDNIPIPETLPMNLYQYLTLHTVNKYSPDYKRLLYTAIITSMMRILSFYSEMDFEYHKHINVYEVYSGNIFDYSNEVANSVNDKVRALSIATDKIIEALLPDLNTSETTSRIFNKSIGAKAIFHIIEKSEE